MLTKEQLQQRVRELEEENDELQDQLDQIFDIIAPPEGQTEHEKEGPTAQGKTDATSTRRDFQDIGVGARRPLRKAARKPAALSLGAANVATHSATKIARNR